MSLFLCFGDKNQPAASLSFGLVLLITDVLVLFGIEEDVADGSYESVNSESDHGKEDVAAGSGCVTLGLERGVVDNKASDPSEEECE